MATNIPAGSPPPPQNRKQVMDASGNYVPVPDIPQVVNKTEDGPPPFVVGDAVMLNGRVTDIHHTQGGLESIKVQTPAGAEWYQAQHLVKVDTAAPKRIAELEAVLAAKDAEIAKMQAELDKATATAATPAPPAKVAPEAPAKA